MALGPFLSHEAGFEALLGGGDWEADPYFAALLADGSGDQNRASESQWWQISGEEIVHPDYSRKALTGKDHNISGTNIEFDCAKITFTLSGEISARYMYVCSGTAASPTGTDPILGHVDLTGSGNASSVSGEFSYDSHTDGLFYVGRTAAP